MLGTCVRLTFGSYLIKLCKWDQNITLQLRFEVKSGLSYKNCARKFGNKKKICGNYVWKLRQNYVTKITLALRQEVTLDLPQETS